MIAEFHFLRPWWLLALLIPPAVIWFAHRSGDIRSQWKTMIAAHLLDHLIIEPHRRRHMAPAWLVAALTSLAILGAAGPTWQREAPPFVSDTAPLTIAIDLSSTMDATDITPSRLERAKLKIRDILAARKGSRTAVVAYAGSPHLVVPLTDDAALVEIYTDALATRIMPKPGKDTSAALRFADDQLKADGAGGTILLITDGVEEASSAAARTIGSGIVILCIGTAEGGILPGAQGSSPVSRLDIDALQRFGRDMGAAVATITDDGSDIRWVMQHVQTNFARQNASNADRWRDVGWWMAIPVALLLAMSFRRGWVVKVSAAMLAFRLFLPQGAEAAGLADMWLTPDQQGRLAFERGDFTSAASRFVDPMWKGAALYHAGRFQESVAAFSSLDTPESWYDRGNALLHLGEFEEAVNAYRSALEKRANWTEAEADLAIAERLLKQKQQDDEDQPEQPNEKPDSVQFDDKGKKGKEGKVDIAEQTSEMWIKNIEVSPADLMARKFALEERGGSP